MNAETAQAANGKHAQSRGFLRVDDKQLEYCRWRNGASHGPTLVLLHEGLGSVAMWKDFPRQLATRTRCSVVAYSRAGYGKSDPATLPRTPGYLHSEGLETLPDVLNFVDAPDVVLLGHSDGASIALIHAGGNADPRVKGAILIAPHVFIEPIAVEQIARARTAYESGDLRKRLEKYHDDVDHAFYGWNDIWLNPEFLSWNIEPYLPKIKIPVLIMQGAKDEYGTLAQVRAVSGQVGGSADTLILPACGHSPHRDEPQVTLARIERYLNERILSYRA